MIVAAQMLSEAEDRFSELSADWQWIAVWCVFIQFASAVLGEHDPESSVHLRCAQVIRGRLLSGRHLVCLHGQLLTVWTSPHQGLLPLSTFLGTIWTTTLMNTYYFSPGMVQSIAMSMSVCLSARISWKLYGQTSPIFLAFWLWLGLDSPPTVDKFCYLGDMLSVDGDADAALETRIRIGGNKFRQFVPLLTNKDISLTVKGRLYSSCVRSSMLHGSWRRIFLILLLVISLLYC